MFRKTISFALRTMSTNKSKQTLAKKLSASARKVPVRLQEGTSSNLTTEIKANTKSNLKRSSKNKNDLKDSIGKESTTNKINAIPKDVIDVKIKEPKRISRNKAEKDLIEESPLEVLPNATSFLIKRQHNVEVPSTSALCGKEVVKSRKKSTKKSSNNEIKDEIKTEHSVDVPSTSNVLETDTNKSVKNKKVTKKTPQENPETCKEEIADKWEPENWKTILENIRIMRSKDKAPVDTMGCHKCADENADEKTQRFHKLVALMLSSQTKDDTTYHAMLRLREHTLTPESICEIKLNVLENILHPVSFYKNKAKYLQQTSKILIEKYNSDIPNNIKELVALPGVGPKMAHICMATAWDVTTGIGVDVHVHRICNRLRWLPKPTKEPEETRKAIENWLPRDLWQEVNYLLVGFGQTICTPLRPKCVKCLNCSICPAAPKTKDTADKRENNEVSELCQKATFKKKKMHI
uniref:Endonuclease III homolog n=1 Tax=Musca domestica TaxID=7370 RepID=A0A1I8MF46_MUSDO